MLTMEELTKGLALSDFDDPYPTWVYRRGPFVFTLENWSGRYSGRLTIRELFQFHRIVSEDKDIVIGGLAMFFNRLDPVVLSEGVNYLLEQLGESAGKPALTRLSEGDPLC